MNSIFDRIKEFIEHNSGIRIGDPDYAINLSSEIADKASYNHETNTLSLNLSKFNPDDIKLFGPILQAAIKENMLLVEKESEEVVEDIITEEQKNAKLLAFFKGKIPHEDFSALRSALYIRKCFRDRSNVDKIHKLKRELIYRYGSRGKSISNLCSSGYFESLLIPMYNEMVVEKKATLDSFLQAYDFIINENAFAVFISGGMTLDDIDKEVSHKIKRNFKYGIKYVSIHGIGQRNIENIRSMIQILDGRYSIKKKDIIEKDNIITARIYFD